MGALDVGTPRGGANRRGDGHHGHVLREQRVGLGVGLGTDGLVGGRAALRQGRVNVGEPFAELVAGTWAEVVVEEVGRIG